MIPDPKRRRRASLDTPTDLEPNAVRDISGALNILLADMFALYVKTKNFHWHAQDRGCDATFDWSHRSSAAGTR